MLGGTLSYGRFPTSPMRLASLALAAVLAAPASVAQTTGLYLYAGMEAHKIDPRGRIADFSETYNATMGAAAINPMGALETTRVRPVVGLGYKLRVDRLGFDLYLAGAIESPQTVQSTVAGNYQHVVEMDVNDQMFGVSLTYQLNDRLFVGATTDAIVRRATVRAKTVYADGSESFGSEQRINGIYTQDESFLGVGGTVGITLGRITPTVRLLWPIEIGGDIRLPLTDYDTFQLNDYFPSDYARFMNDPNGLDDGAAIHGRDFVGPRLTVGVDVRLF